MLTTTSRPVNIHEAKTHLSQLLAEVAEGAEIVIARAGVPIAKLVPIGDDEPGSISRIGFLEGAFKIPADFDTMGSSQITAMFSGEA
jgi:prevent-host-death family protein